MTYFYLINIILAGLVIFVGSFKNLLFMGIVICNTGIGIFQEIRAKKTLDKLSLITATKVKVVREGTLKEIPVEEVVLDDIMLLGAGNQICADATVREGMLEVNESLISGESDIIVKRQGDQLFSGSFVVSGQAMVQVIHVGTENFSYKIMSEARAYKKHKSELQKSIDVILKIIGILIIPLGVGMFYSQYAVAHASFGDAVVNMVAAVLGMIPEGLVLLTSIALAVGVIHLGKHNTLVHELFCIETLARVDVLCLDKTGTLTEGRMKVEDVIPLEEVPVDEIVGNMLHCLKDNNATFMAMKEYFPDRADYTAVHTIPFSSARKYSGASFQGKGTFLIGAYEFMFPQEKEEDSLKYQIDQHTRKGIRVLVLAHSEEIAEENELPEDMIPCAIILLSDIIREDARETLKYFADRDVRLMVISGDNPATVSNIAKKAGLADADSYVDATTLDSDSALEAAVEKYHIFGRVTPEQKKKIVLALKKQKHIVAMTGDGVNDAPALKKADIGVAMGITGTEVSKDAASMILADDNFATIIKAVSNGRNVYRNIKNSIQFLLSGNMAGIFCVLYTSLLSLPLPFKPVHLLFINLITDSLPAIAIGMEPPEEGLLKEPPRNPKEGILTASFIRDILVQGALIAAATMWAYTTGLHEGGAGRACTMAFSTLTLARLFHGFNCRSSHSIIRLGLGSNLYSVMAFQLGVVLLAAVLFVPGLQIMFAAADLSLSQLTTLAAAAFLPTLAIQIHKILRESIN